MKPIMHINVPPQEYLEEFYNKCHDEAGRFCGDSSGSDDRFSSYSDRGRRRAADLKSGKEFKPLSKAKFNSELDDAETWPEKWISDKKGKFSVPTFRKGERGLQDPVSYDEATREHNLLEISRTRNGKKEFLSPEADHLTARMKAIGLDKVISPKELSRMVREEKPVWVDEESSNKWRFYKIPKLSDEIGVGVADDGTIGTVIPGGYKTMAIDELGTDHASKSQLGRLLMRESVTQQYPSDETVTPTVKIDPVKVGKTTFKY